jgi:hypothetical protein
MCAAHGKQYQAALAKSQKHPSMAARHGLRGSIFYSARISPSHNWNCPRVIRRLGGEEFLDLVTTSPHISRVNH